MDGKLAGMNGEMNWLTRRGELSFLMRNRGIWGPLSEGIGET
jgi:hypothetical protein